MRPPDGLLSLPTERPTRPTRARSKTEGWTSRIGESGANVVQCDGILNVASSFKTAAEKRAGDDRTLKLSLTDGKQRIVGYEYRPCDSLHVLAPA